MATQERTRSGRQSATPQNSATMGVILVLVALVVGIFLLVKGGGDAKGQKKETPASAAQGTDGSGPAKTTVPPSTTPVAALEIIVGNGSGVSGRAKKTAELLKTAGYSLVTYVDGKETATSQVYFVAGFDADARAIATSLNLPAERVVQMPPEVPLKDTLLGTAKVVVLVGPDFDPASPPPATSSTAPG